MARASCDHEWKQVLFPRMRVPALRCVQPSAELDPAFFKITCFEYICQPCVEFSRRCGGHGCPEGAHIMIAHAAADDEDAFFSQLADCLADLQMFFRREVAGE